ncbi:MAG: lactonase family protein [Aggregatilineales bacterium]
MSQSQEIIVYISGEADADSAGIHIFELDITTGAFTPINTVITLANCGYLNFHPSGRFLLAAGAEGDNATIHSFVVDPTTGSLTALNYQPADIESACYVAPDIAGQYVLAVTYGNPDGMPGSAYVYPMLPDGKIGERSDYQQYEGKSVNPERQERSHPHMIVQHPASQLMVVPDLGTDRLMLHHLDMETGKFNDRGFISLPAGAGPRHIAFKEQYLYVINELNSSINVFTYDADSEKYDNLQMISTLPGDSSFTGENYPADIHLHPSGKFLYGTNRGHNSIVVYCVAGDGRLTLTGHTPTQGDWPRAFYIDPTGKLLICANKKTNDVFTFWIDNETGELTPTGHSVAVSLPNCVRCLMPA